MFSSSVAQITQAAVVLAALPVAALTGVLIYETCKSTPSTLSSDPTIRVIAFAIGIFATIFAVLKSPSLAYNYLKNIKQFDDMTSALVSFIVLPPFVVITGITLSLSIATMPPLGVPRPRNRLDAI